MPVRAASATWFMLVAIAASIFVAVGCGEKREDAPRPVATETPARTAAAEPMATPAPPWMDAERALHGDAAHGKELVKKFECNRCHEGTGLAAPMMDRQCTGCHQAIHADKYPQTAAKLDEWKKVIVHFRDVPTLAAIGTRVKTTWL